MDGTTVNDVRSAGSEMAYVSHGSLASQLPMAGSVHKGRLPVGCLQCQEGAKLVLFITGLCDKECFYCPVGRDRMYTDVVYANERPVPVGDWAQIIDECELIGADGCGITGGDPMVVPERVEELVRLLKERFGPDFHTHLYTSCAFDLASLQRLRAAGLDEIRFHPELREYTRMEASWHHAAIAESLRLGLTTLCEIPCVPGKEQDIVALASYLQGVGAHGLNMNELEFSEPNIAALKRFGYVPRDDESQRVAGSRDTGLAVLDAWEGEMLVHFCSSPYKDAIQLRQRLRRRATRTARPFDEKTPDGTIIFGVLKPHDGDTHGLLAILQASYDVEYGEARGNVVEVEAAVAEALAEGGALSTLGADAWLSEVYPTADRLEVERIPLRP